MFKQFSFKNLGQNKAAGLATEMRYTAVKAKNVLHILSCFIIYDFIFISISCKITCTKNALSSLINKALFSS